MAIEIKMPRLSQTTDEVKLLSWLVREGDTVEKGDQLCEVETDKVTMAVESFEGGTVLRLFGEPDSVIDAGTVIAILGRPGESVKADEGPGAVGMVADAAAGADADTIIGAAGPVERVEVGDLPVRATKLVLNIARKRGIDLSGVRGTGPRGLITKKDLDSLAASGRSANAPAGARSPEAPAPAGLGAGPAGETAPGAEIALSPHQAAVARSLSMSKRDTPHYYLKTEIIADGLIRAREESDPKLSFDAFFVFAVSRALKANPRLNGYFRDFKLVLHSGIHVAVAVSVDSGGVQELYAPVVRDAVGMSIGEIDLAVRELAAKVRNGSLEPEYMTGGSFTVTNLGMYPVDEFCAIINPPQAGIVAVGRMKKALVVEPDDTMRVRTLCTVMGSFDHRIVNGTAGAAFLEHIKTILEDFKSV